MKNVSAFLKRHSALLLLVLVLATVPAGIAFGKYVKSVNVTNGISITVSVATPASDYTIHKGKLKDVLQDLQTPATALYFVKGSEVPKDAVQVVDKDTTRAKDIRANSKSGSIYAYQKGTDIYIAPADRVDAPLHAPADSSYFLSINYTDRGGDASKINLLKSIKCDNLDTSRVTKMRRMFYMGVNNTSDTALTTLDVSKFNTANVTDMSYMFQGCSALTELDLSSFDTSKVTNMSSMFYECKSLTSLDLRNFDTRKVTDMSYMFYMFNGNTALTKLDLSSFNTSKVTTMMGMFKGCTLLPELDVSNFNTSNVTNMQSMFDTCGGLTKLDLSNFDTSKVTDMSSMFADCRGLTSLNVSSFDTSKVTSMAFIFRACTTLPTLDVSNFNTSSVASMQGMFDTCRSLTSLDVSSFNTSKAMKMENMFRSCSSLTTLDLSSFDVKSSCAKASMFEECTALKTIYASQDWAVEGNSTGMNMFKNCTLLVGGKGTVYSDSNTYLTYARIDDPENDKPGYFTDIKAKSTLSANGSSKASNFGFTS